MCVGSVDNIREVNEAERKIGRGRIDQNGNGSSSWIERGGRNGNVIAAAPVLQTRNSDDNSEGTGTAWPGGNDRGECE